MRAVLESDGITAAIGSTKQQSTLKDKEHEKAADEQSVFYQKKGPSTAIFKNLHGHFFSFIRTLF